MKVALAQIASPDPETPAHRLERVRQMLAAFSADADLIVLPELWRVGYSHFDSYQAAAEDLDGATVQVLQAIARDRTCYVHAGSIIEHTDGGKLRNTAVLIDPEGRITHHYSKIHVFGYQSLETELLQPGQQIQVADTAFGPIGATTCYDLRFPGLWTELVQAGAEIVIVPAAWPKSRLAHWRLLTSARAVDNQVVVIACNAVGTHNGVEFGGHSRIVDPWGEVLAEAGDSEGITLAELDPAVVARTRAEFPVLGDRLDDYSFLNMRKVLS
ncbi:carbon-nitrogen family hydrolase [Nocardia donostiensis]|uniref:Carbon-nitrogen hydrolase n=1 Tax=Nocardia donostiensis TaxID=1538463 RepID=A0A1V2THG4_9NOCA|nr:carbon-nitrogen family hydrolase [Nocardia donostiensis]ONM48960.1 carbon-nitrogen hydrolase [Nocardia donostiensis]OQS13048.1 carbon-nitrogen hydrolase [Nocardia donostiensis]OQS22974.1 carbon-nitrogen hydrolase [Nocardia donostiensis]